MPRSHSSVVLDDHTEFKAPSESLGIPRDLCPPALSETTFHSTKANFRQLGDCHCVDAAAACCCLSPQEVEEMTTAVQVHTLTPYAVSATQSKTRSAGKLQASDGGKVRWNPQYCTSSVSLTPPCKHAAHAAHVTGLSGLDSSRRAVTHRIVLR